MIHSLGSFASIYWLESQTTAESFILFFEFATVNATYADERYMWRCIQLARLGAGYTMPNPMVGAVLVHEGRIIGEGWHQKAGLAHAEVAAVAAVLAEDRHLIPDATLFVNLEPCNHEGRTPPCTDLILRESIKRVVIGSMDYNPMVGGQGIARLRGAGVEVVTGVLEKECRELNRRFFISHQLKRPFITLKWAESTNGYIAEADGSPVRITGTLTQRLTHQLRSQHMGILVGWKTIANDQPLLDNRMWRGQSPQVVIIDLNGRLDKHHLLDQHPEWWRWVNGGLAVREGDFSTESDGLDQLVGHLFAKGVQSLLVEGGAATLGHFLHQGLWDELYRYIGAKNISQGIPAPNTCGMLMENYLSGHDIIEIYRR